MDSRSRFQEQKRRCLCGHEVICDDDQATEMVFLFLEIFLRNLQLLVFTYSKRVCSNDFQI